MVIQKDCYLFTIGGLPASSTVCSTQQELNTYSLYVGCGELINETVPQMQVANPLLVGQISNDLIKKNTRKMKIVYQVILCPSVSPLPTPRFLNYISNNPHCYFLKQWRVNILLFKSQTTPYVQTILEGIFFHVNYIVPFF